MYRAILFILLFVSEVSFSQNEITWDDLADVEFEELYSEEIDEFVLYPHFGSSIRELAGKQVLLRGHILTIDPSEGYFILSKGPIWSCFFCGAGGPETVVELNFESDKNDFVMDEVVTIKGTLRLNSEDIYQCVYILDYAEVSSR
jgi:hypothetical protein